MRYASFMRAPLDGSVALVTGASSGIGEAIARQLSTRVRHLVMVARRKERLVRLADELRSDRLEVTVAPCDLTDRRALDKMLDVVASDVGTVDILVNNAGFGDMGMFDLADWTKTERMIDVNVTALCYLTHRLIGPMVAQRRGGILMVSSGFGLTFLPGFAGYVGTKHFVTGFTESLRLDVKSRGVVVTQVCPGPVATEFEQNVGNFVGGQPQSFVEISAERCAKAALRGFERGRAMVVPGVLIKISLFLAAITPRWFLRLLYGPPAKWLRRTQDEADGS